MTQSFSMSQASARRSVFVGVRELVFVGADYLCSPLDDKYIEYKYRQYEWGYLAMIHTEMIENLIQQLDHYFTGMNFSYFVLVYSAGFFL